MPTSTFGSDSLWREQRAYFRAVERSAVSTAYLTSRNFRKEPSSQRIF
jgi:hypothetical protein